MNNVLQLKGRLQVRPSKGRGGGASLPKGKDKKTGLSPAVTTTHMRRLAQQLDDLCKRWQGVQVIKGALVDVYYRDVIAKSNRIRALFKEYPREANDTVVGARFAEDGNHIITHHVTEAMLKRASRNLRTAVSIVEAEFGGRIDTDELDDIKAKEIDFIHYGMAESVFCQLVVDSYFVTHFDYPEKRQHSNEMIVTLYKVSDNMREVLRSIGITTVTAERMFDDATVRLYPDELETLYREAPYLVAMAVEDLNEVVGEDDYAVRETAHALRPSIRTPGNEPVVGVIDTVIDPDLDNLYFADWVEYVHMLDDDGIETTVDDRQHGTAVTSIIVDGPLMSPELDDGCGNFRVKHFGVARTGRMSSFHIMCSIENIVRQNPSIRVWNLSLGSPREVAKSYISPEAAMLDKLQNECNVIFVVSGTNDFMAAKPGDKLIGAPADSVNSIVVNAVNAEGLPASYTRKGQVLSFFKKPDMNCFGGDSNHPMNVYTPNGPGLMVGTSLAAPWITRKVAFMIEVLGLSREVAKALLVDAAADWNDTGNDLKQAPLLGYGSVPTHINDVVQSKDNEIKFTLEKTSTDYDTYTYSLPVPVDNEKHPFIAKATLCYFPECSINQGVDYTDIELDVYIGRIETIQNKPPRLKSIDKNVQSLEDDEQHYVTEKTARQVFRKWDNTKHIREVMKDKLVARKAYTNGMWGISVKRKNRLKKDEKAKVKFGLVVTLREINNVNRINDFIQNCSLHGWLVNKIDVENSLDIYAKSQETIEL